MASPNEKIVQELGLVFTTDEQSKEQVLRSLDEINSKAKSVNDNMAAGSEGASKLSETLRKDLGGALDKFSPALGEIGGLLKAAGPVTALVTGFILVVDKMADLNKEAVDVNRQFSSMYSTIKDIADLQNHMSMMGYDKEETNNITSRLARNGAASTAEQLTDATITTGAFAKMTGMETSSVANMIAMAVKSGALDANNLQGGVFGEGGKPGLFQNMTKGAAEASMSMEQYSKSLFDLWGTTRNYNISFEDTQKLMGRWGDSLNKGIVSLNDIAALSTGSKFSDGQKIFMAQQMGIEGSPLEMMTKFEASLSKPEFQERLGTKVYDMAKQRAKSPTEMVEWVRMMNDTLTGGSIPGLNSLGGALSFLESHASDQDRGKYFAVFPGVVNNQNEEQRVIARMQNESLANDRAKRLNSPEAIKDQLGIDVMSTSGVLSLAKRAVGLLYNDIGAGADQEGTMRHAMGFDSQRGLKAFQGLDPHQQAEALREMSKFTGATQSKPIELKLDNHQSLDINIKMNGQQVSTQRLNSKPGTQSFTLPAGMDMGITVEGHK